MPNGSYVSRVVEDQTPGAARTIVAGGGANDHSVATRANLPGSRLAFVYNVYTEPEHRGGLAAGHERRPRPLPAARESRSIALNASEFGQPLYETMGYAVTPSPMMFLALR